MAVRLPSVFGDDDFEEEGFRTPTRVTASGFTETTAHQPNQNQASLSEISQLADILKQMSTKMDRLESEVKSVRADSAYDDGETQVTQKIRGLHASNRTIIPQDSISNVKPNNYQSPAIRDSETFEKSVSSRQECLYDSVIGGFAQTPEEKMEELEALTKIRRIYGLPQIFQNERLNFLIHIHKPLTRLLANGNDYPAQDTLYRIDDFMKRRANKVRSQHEDLLYSVIETTVHKGRIRSNPHNLPILEVGMSLTDKLAYICFASLYREFQTEWFQSMKDIDAPQFHNTYSDFKSERAPSSRKERPSKSSGAYRRSADSGSIVSFLRG